MNKTDKEKVKRLNEFFTLFVAKPADMNNQSFYKRYGFRQDEFYTLRKNLVNLKRISRKTFRMINDKGISLDEYQNIRYPRKEKRVVNRKKRVVKEVNGADGLLTKELTFPVKENDNVNISLQEFTRVIIRLVQEGHLK